MAQFGSGVGDGTYLYVFKVTELSKVATNLINRDFAWEILRNQLVVWVRVLPLFCKPRLLPLRLRLR